MAKKFKCKCGASVIDTRQNPPNELCTDCDDLLMHVEAKGREWTDAEISAAVQPDLFLEVPIE